MRWYGREVLIIPLRSCGGGSRLLRRLKPHALRRTCMSRLGGLCPLSPCHVFLASLRNKKCMRSRAKKARSVAFLRLRRRPCPLPRPLASGRAGRAHYGGRDSPPPPISRPQSSPVKGQAVRATPALDGLGRACRLTERPPCVPQGDGT